MSEILVATGALPAGASARGKVAVDFSAGAGVPAANAAWARAADGVVYTRPLASPWPSRITDVAWALHDATDTLISRVVRSFSTDDDLVSTNPYLALPAGGRLLVWAGRPGGYTASWQRLFTAAPRTAEAFWLLFNNGRTGVTEIPAGLVVSQYYVLRAATAESLPAPATGYATRADLVARFGAAEIDDLAPDVDGVSRAGVVLGEAAAEIDSVLARTYELPLPAARYPLLTGIACDIARLRLYDDAAPEIVLGRGSSARKRLREIAEGARELVSATGAAIATPEADGAMVAPADPLWTRARLWDL